MADSLLVLNSTITSTDTITSLLKETNRIMLELFSEQDSVFHGNNKVILENIASLCPMQYGIGVNIARAMIKINNDTIEFINSCEILDQNTSNLRLEENQNIVAQEYNKLYPNPTANEVYLAYQLEEGEIGILEISNAIGQRLGWEEGIKGKGNKAISLANYSEGIYLVSFRVNGKIIDNWKLSVQK